MKIKTFLFWVVLPLIVLITYWKITRSNLVSVKLADCKNGSVETIRELNKQLKRNFLDRESYEVSAYTDLGPCFLVNYDKKYKLLRVAVDPPSGWSGYYKATPQQLQEIVDKKLNEEEISKYLEPFPPANYPQD